MFKKMLLTAMVAVVLGPSVAQAQNKIRWDAMFQTAAQEAPGCWYMVQDFQTYTTLRNQAFGDYRMEIPLRVQVADVQTALQRTCPKAWAAR